MNVYIAEAWDYDCYVIIGVFTKLGVAQRIAVKWRNFSASRSGFDLFVTQFMVGDESHNPLQAPQWTYDADVRVWRKD